MKYMFAIGTLAFALTTATVDARQDTYGTPETRQQGAAEQQDTTETTGTSGVQTQGQDPSQEALPSTASPLAMVLLGGLGALGAGFALRRARE